MRITKAGQAVVNRLKEENRGLNERIKGLEKELRVEKSAGRNKDRKIERDAKTIKDLRSENAKMKRRLRYHEGPSAPGGEEQGRQEEGLRGQEEGGRRSRKGGDKKAQARRPAGPHGAQARVQADPPGGHRRGRRSRMQGRRVRRRAGYHRVREQDRGGKKAAAGLRGHRDPLPQVMVQKVRPQMDGDARHGRPAPHVRRTKRGSGAGCGRVRAGLAGCGRVQAEIGAAHRRAEWPRQALAAGRRVDCLLPRKANRRPFRPRATDNGRRSDPSGPVAPCSATPRRPFAPCLTEMMPPPPPPRCPAA